MRASIALDIPPTRYTGRIFLTLGRWLGGEPATICHGVCFAVIHRTDAGPCSGVWTWERGAFFMRIGEPVEMRPLRKRPGMDPTKISCGCCAGPENNRCTCWMHQDRTRGIPPRTCTRHR